MVKQEDVFIGVIESYTALSSSSRQVLLSHSDIQVVPKNEVFISEGKHNHYEYFLLEGIAHRFNTDEKGKVITTGFIFPRTVLTPHFARSAASGSLFSVQALTDLVLARIPATEFNQIRTEYSDLSLFGNKVVEKELSNSIRNETIFRSQSAQERLLQMREDFPNLENLVPNHIIASYLGITPVSLSRLRNSLATSA